MDYLVRGGAARHASSESDACGALSCRIAGRGSGAAAVLTRRRHTEGDHRRYRQCCRAQTRPTHNDVDSCSHLFISRRSLRARRVSCFNMCFVNTPREQNLTPSPINLRITSSPSWLIAVMCFISITSSRPLRSALAFSHALLSSAAHGAVSLPSNTKRRRVGVSMNEIFSILCLPNPHDKGNGHAK